MRVHLVELDENPPQALIESAKRHAHAVERWGLLHPRMLDSRLASLHSFDAPPDAAVDYFARAIEQRPRDLAARIQFAQTLLRLGRADEADSQLLAAATYQAETKHAKIEIDRQRLAAANMLGQLRGNAGDLDGAAEAFGIAISIRSDDAQAHAGMSQTMSLMGRHDEAERHRLEFIRLMEEARKAQAPAPGGR